jgi:hypothetical protein
VCSVDSAEKSESATKQETLRLFGKPLATGETLGWHPELPERGDMTNDYDSRVEKMQQHEFEIGGITFVRDHDNAYGARWKVFESGSWQESKHSADEYGTVENRGDDFCFTPNIVCTYPLFLEVLQIIATFIKRDERTLRTTD